jgi:hypothetical protein
MCTLFYFKYFPNKILSTKNLDKERIMKNHENKLLEVGNIEDLDTEAEESPHAVKRIIENLLGEESWNCNIFYGDWCSSTTECSVFLN